MSQRTDTERKLDAYLAPEADRLPDRVLDAALADIARTPQRRALRVPWRFMQMTNSMRAAAAIAIVAIVGVGALAFINRGPSFGGQPTLAPSPSPTPSPTPSVRPVPTATPIPQLTETFTSAIHGISTSYPAGWVLRAASAPWPAGEIVTQESEFADVIEDGSLGDTAFLALASRPLGGTAFDQWATDYLALEGCAPSEPVTVDGASGVISLGCSMALVSAGGRGYLIWLYRIDDRAQFLGVLGTVDLRPEDAIDAAPSETP